jgi:LacI family transcriptional regulator
MQKAVRLSDVAKAAGVSLNTASRAIRADGYVSDDARQRVLAAAEQLRYRPNVLARRMRGDKARLIGVFVNGIGWAVVQKLVAAISDEARRLDFDLVIFDAYNFSDPHRVGTSDMLRGLCDGLVIVLPNNADSYLEVLEREQAPVVLLNFDARPIDLPVIVGDNRAGGRMAVEHLLALGHRRIAFIAGTSATGQSTARQQGYADALEAAGIAVDPGLLEGAGFEQRYAIPATERLLALPDPPTAIFAANDQMAIGAIEAIGARGLRVPDDISVVGFDDIELASYVQPTLTTVRQPLADMGVRAVGVLCDRLRGRFDAGRSVFPAEFVPRQSTGPAKR